MQSSGGEVKKHRVEVIFRRNRKPDLKQRTRDKHLPLFTFIDEDMICLWVILFGTCVHRSLWLDSPRTVVSFLFPYLDVRVCVLAWIYMKLKWNSFLVWTNQKQRENVPTMSWAWLVALNQGLASKITGKCMNKKRKKLRRKECNMKEIIGVSSFFISLFLCAS